MKNVWLVRHGESQSNAGEITSDTVLDQLTQRGRDQAQDIANAITVEPERIFYTPYVRTRQSAQPLLDKFPQAFCEEWPLQEFTYLNPCNYAGTTREQRRQVKYRYWKRCDPDYCDGGGAESYIDFLNRVESCFKLLRRFNGYVIVYTHGHVIRAMLWYLLRGGFERSKAGFLRYFHLRQALSIPNGAILKLDLNATDPTISPLLIQHLTD